MTHRRVFAVQTALLPVLLAVALFGGPAASAQDKPIDKIVAVVGNEIITKSELDLQIIRMSMRNKVDINDPALRAKVLEEMISRKLILAQAVLDSVTVSDEQVTAQLNEQIRMFEQQYGSTQRLEQAAGMTIAQMKREFREDIRKNLMVETLQREKFGAIAVSNREVEEFFRAYRDSLPQVPEQVHLRQITVFPRVLDTFKDAARRKAEALADSLRAGADFADLAKRTSDDAGSARNGGDLGEARRGVFVKEFEEAVFALKPGEISPVVETPFGFHIVKLMERKGEAVRAQHILIRVQKTGESDDAAKQKLLALRARILAGEDFVVLARAESQDEATRNLGGDLGLLEVQQLGDDMKLIQQKLKDGEISEPSKITFERDYGFALVQLTRRISPHAPTLKDDYQRIMNFARIYKQNKLYLDWIGSIKNSVYWKML
ncbi:MAG: peptidylprolyl isomerase [Ignavibacteria bacterium]|nr:peptidylprolyl isomerase [Ignavibacteria bacterium]